MCIIKTTKREGGTTNETNNNFKFLAKLAQIMLCVCFYDVDATLVYSKKCLCRLQKNRFKFRKRAVQNSIWSFLFGVKKTYTNLIDNSKGNKQL